MLELKPNCERCDTDLPPESTQARICSFECTFCHDCVEQHLNGICPNCGGNFVARPIRPARALEKFPASTTRVPKGTSTPVHFRSYRDSDRQCCLDIFDANCPEFFALNERQEYREFLNDVPAGYEVCEVDGQVLGAFGLLENEKGEKRLNWIMLDPQSQGLGIGQRIMHRVIDQGRASGSHVVRIAASQKSAPFFAKFGATNTSVEVNGWGPGMDRVDMDLSL